ncbi:MAG: beta-ribofuranosylaminobenzene 5'-phosphate synthase family protein [Halobacteria archaeon]|nr:beta-ribofuranosylaminobenzene 5'-phosphate synthase family protein [Halobacteria archaeon]
MSDPESQSQSQPHDGFDVGVETTARLHFGFVNLSLARRRIYGGVGVAVDRPHAVLRARRSDEVSVTRSGLGSEYDTDFTGIESYARRAVSLLGVDGVEIEVERHIPRHVGLGSGTQIALGVLRCVAEAHGVESDLRTLAPEMGRGGRSGVGVACFESGGFVLDAGHPSERFTSRSPERGDWEVPPVVARHNLPDDWRFVVVVPEAEEGKHGDEEETSIRRVIESADPSVADEISNVVLDRVLPGVASGDIDEFGAGVEEIGRLNGAWYTRFQGGVYREESKPVVEELRSLPAVKGVGQSSWGPSVYGVTTEDRAVEVAGAVDGEEREVYVAEPDNTGHELV